MTNADTLIERLLANPEVREGYDEQAAIIEIGRLVRSMREAAHLSQEALAQSIGTSQPHVSMIERGLSQYGPTIKMLNRIARSCGVTIEMRLIPDKKDDAVEAPAAHARILKRVTKPRTAASTARLRASA